jgi:hypothetical protein
MKRRRKRKCLGCGEGFHPSPQNRHKQRFCGLPECARKSARASRRKWQEKNPDYFKGPENVLRVRRWRERNPGWRRRKKGGLSADVLQDYWISEGIVHKEDNAELKHFVLQEDWFLQNPFIVGLISNLSGTALQEDIAVGLRNLHKRGQEILGIRSGVATNPIMQVAHEKEDHQPGAFAAGSGPVQLGRSPPGPPPAP